jgi:hypothetical protein
VLSAGGEAAKMDTRHGAYELVSSHASPQRGRSRGAAAASALLAAGGLALVVVAVVSGGGLLGGAGEAAASRSLIQQRDALLQGIQQRDPLLGGPPAQKGAAHPAPPATALAVRHVATAVRSRAAVQSLAEAPPVRVLFDKEAQSQTVQSYINSGHMKCCVRDNNDLEDEVYPKYYDDFPMDPVCIPGYRKDGDDCIACDADHYCPTKEDLVLKCPPNTWSPIASGEVSECWCHEGFYGKDPSLQHGADCHPCPADKFCAGGKLRVSGRGRSGDGRLRRQSVFYVRACVVTRGALRIM